MKAIIVIASSNTNDIEKGLIDRFCNQGRIVESELLSHFNFSPDDVMRITPAEHGNSPQKLKKMLTLFFLENLREDICVFYVGHGSPNGWPLSGIQDESVLPYEDVRLIFAHHHRSLIFLNSCCYAGAGEKALASHSGEHLLIAALPEDKFGYAENFFVLIFGHWLQGQFFNPLTSTENEDCMPVIVGDEHLQALFFGSACWQEE